MNRVSGRGKKLLAILALSIPLAAVVRNRTPGSAVIARQSSAAALGGVVALVDLTREHYAVLAFGLPTRWRPEAARLLRDRYRIEMRVVADCDVDNLLIAYVRGYNAVSTRAAKLKFGHDVFAESMADAARNWEGRQPPR